MSLEPPGHVDGLTDDARGDARLGAPDTEVAEERTDLHGVLGSPLSRALRLGALVALVVLLGLWQGMSMLIVVAALVVMIFLHELGHYVMAKRAGMLVTEFFIGFGPRIWSFRRGETEYGIKAIPAGAYVRIIGMSNMEEVDPALESRTYRQKRFSQRIGVAVAGSSMHFLLALVLLFVQFAFIGGPDGERRRGGRRHGLHPRLRPHPQAPRRRRQAALRRRHQPQGVHSLHQRGRRRRARRGGRRQPLQPARLRLARPHAGLSTSREASPA